MSKFLIPLLEQLFVQSLLLFRQAAKGLAGKIRDCTICPAGFALEKGATISNNHGNIQSSYSILEFQLFFPYPLVAQYQFGESKSLKEIALSDNEPPKSSMLLF